LHSLMLTPQGPKTPARNGASARKGVKRPGHHTHEGETPSRNHTSHATQHPDEAIEVQRCRAPPHHSPPQVPPPRCSAPTLRQLVRAHRNCLPKFQASHRQPARKARRVPPTPKRIETSPKSHRILHRLPARRRTLTAHRSTNSPQSLRRTEHRGGMR